VVFSNHRYIALVIMIIAGLALAAVIGWTLATVVLYDFDPSRYACMYLLCTGCPCSAMTYHLAAHTNGPLCPRTLYSEQIADIACRKKLPGCSGCDNIVSPCRLLVTICTTRVPST
jgi:hypothetical protein